jgi:uncharacterized protein
LIAAALKNVLERARNAPSKPVVRYPELTFGDDVPRWWLHENPVLTHAANGLHLVFPEGERFFIRSVRHYWDRIEDPALRERCKVFFAQESRHGQEHQRSFEMLERQGYDVRSFLDLYEQRGLPGLESLFPPALLLAVTVALEHLTATLGEAALEEDFLDGAHPQMERLLRWHACEEIEHKSVAFDVFQTVDGRWYVRIGGMVLGMAALMFFWTLGARKLLAQETGIGPEAWASYKRQAKALRGGSVRRLFQKAFLEYLDPRFHPDQIDNYALATAYLRKIGV